jgi:hypothetical protein
VICYHSSIVDHDKTIWSGPAVSRQVFVLFNFMYGREIDVRFDRMQHTRVWAGLLRCSYRNARTDCSRGRNKMKGRSGIGEKTEQTANDSHDRQGDYQEVDGY